MAYSFTQDPEVSWAVVTDGSVFETYVRELAEQKFFAWDVESDGLNPFKGRRICGHAFAWRRPNGKLVSFYVPIRHESLHGLFGTVPQLDADMVTAALKPILEGPGTKAGHNLAADVLLAWADKINVTAPIHETMTGDKLHDENQRSYKLHDVLARRKILHDPEWKNFIKPDLMAASKELYGTPGVQRIRDEHGYKFVDPHRLGLYACQDAAYELRLAESQTFFNNRWWDTWKLEMDLFWCAIDMQITGVPIVPQILQDLAAEQQAVMADLAPQIFRLAGEEFVLGNDTQLRRILFERLGYPSHGQTKGRFADGARTGQQDKIDDDALWWLETKHGCKLAGLQRIWNKSSKIVTTYTLPIVELADPNDILHCQFDPMGAKTGRFSARSPNLQNIPIRTELGRRIREAFTAREGMIRFCLDYSQVELRMLTHLSQDPILLQVYRENGDIHSRTALEVFGTDQKQEGIDIRRTAKILNFGIPFGITSEGVMRNINKDLPSGQAPMDESRAQWALDGWYSKYSGVDTWRRSMCHQFRQNDGIGRNMYGRPRRIPGIVSHREWERSQAERHLISSMVQGGSADLIKRSMLAAWQYIKSQQNTEAYLVLNVHDDLQFDMAPAGSAQTVREVKRLMESTCQAGFSVPITVDCEYFTTNWKEKRELKGF